jgi:hypothetical protein
VHPAGLFLELGFVIFTLGVLGRLSYRIGLSPVLIMAVAGPVIARLAEPAAARLTRGARGRAGVAVPPQPAPREE